MDIESIKRKIESLNNLAKDESTTESERATAKAFAERLSDKYSVPILDEVERWHSVRFSLRADLAKRILFDILRSYGIKEELLAINKHKVSFKCSDDLEAIIMSELAYHHKTLAHIISGVEAAYTWKYICEREKTTTPKCNHCDYLEGCICRNVDSELNGKMVKNKVDGCPLYHNDSSDMIQLGYDIAQSGSLGINLNPKKTLPGASD
jgi:hypothetical protein